jgi:hypothetical protein
MRRSVWRVLGPVLAVDVMALACVHCGSRAISPDSRDGVAHAVNLDRMALRYIEAGTDPALLITAAMCSGRGVLAREGAPMAKDDGGCQQ